MDLVVAALVLGAIVVAIKVARSGKQLSRKREEREVRHHDRHESLPRADVEPYAAEPYAAEPYQSSVPTQQPPRPAPSAHDVDDELARLKREMGR
jgi:hypothetical protein